ncbi:hypothetical protein H9P43_002730 [Blastocladiella emersonii ATCC 22665]|nr:hypothetical protein H9P43_002730 [Blastocladiella emersonii ATCC 22665]
MYSSNDTTTKPRRGALPVLAALALVLLAAIGHASAVAARPSKGHASLTKRQNPGAGNRAGITAPPGPIRLSGLTFAGSGCSRDGGGPGGPGGAGGPGGPGGPGAPGGPGGAGGPGGPPTGGSNVFDPVAAIASGDGSLIEVVFTNFQTVLGGGGGGGGPGIPGAMSRAQCDYGFDLDVPRGYQVAVQAATFAGGAQVLPGTEAVHRALVSTGGAGPSAAFTFRPVGSPSAVVPFSVREELPTLSWSPCSSGGGPIRFAISSLSEVNGGPGRPTSLGRSPDSGTSSETFQLAWRRCPEPAAAAPA